MTFYFINSNRGGRMVILDDYCYRRHNGKNTTEYFRCRKSRDDCKARLTMMHDQITDLNDNHNHEPESDYIVNLEMKNEMKENVTLNPAKPIQQIYSGVVTKRRQNSILNDSELAKEIPIYENIKNGLYKVKHKSIPSNPNTRSQLILNGNWTKANNDKEFLQVNDDDDDKIMIFGTIDFLKKLCDCKTIYMDGTFYISPDIFSQIYSVHGFYKNQMICFLYCLFQTKQKKRMLDFFV